MKIGDEISILGRIVDLDCNPQGSAIKVEIVGCKPEEKDLGWQGNQHRTAVRFWIHRLDQPSSVKFAESKET